MHYLITGIDGFVGKHLAEHLLSLNHTVSGTILHESHIQNIQSLKDRVSVHNCDLKHKNSVTGVLKTVRPEALIHLAGFANPSLSWKHIEETMAVNAIGSIHLLECLKDLSMQNVKTLMVCTQDVYGNIEEDHSEINEKTPFSPNNPYAISKTCVDFLSRLYASHDQMHVMVARPGNHSGPGQSSLYVISDFCRQVAQIEKHHKEPVIHVGNLNTYKDFTDVRDIVTAYTLLIEKGTPGEAYNVASGNLIKIEDILKTTIQLSKIKIDVKIDPNKYRDIKNKRTPINIDKLTAATDWKPALEIRQTIQDTLNWWRHQLEKNDIA